MREAKAAGQLHHPNIVPVFGAGTHGNQWFIASAFIEGKTLASTLQDDSLDFREAATSVVKLADALAYAHHSGVIHRDVKPENILVDAGGDPVLMDFGLARFQDSEDRLTHDGTVLGTPAYMAPEQASGQQDLVGPASDQYGLGAVFYELLCGRPPFSGRPSEVILNVVSQTPPPPRSVDSRIPRDLETICVKAMAKEPGARFDDCNALAADLRRWLQGQPIHARRLGPLERFSRWCRRNPAMAALSTTAVLLALGLALVASVAYVRTARAFQSAVAQRQEAVNKKEEATEALGQEAEARKTAAIAEQEARLALERLNEVRGCAEAEWEKAENERRQAETRKQEAETEERRADEATQDRTTQQKRSAATDYFRNIAMARQRLIEKNTPHAEPLLAACSAELRHWEWGYLKTACRLQHLTEDAPRYHRQDPRQINRVAFSHDGKRVASANRDGTIGLWDAVTGAALNPLETAVDQSLGVGPIRCVAFSPDGMHIALGADRVTAIYDIATGQEVVSFGGHTGPAEGVAFHPNGKQVASASQSGVVKIWDAASGEVRLTLSAQCTGVCFSPDGKRIATPNGYGAVRVWDSATGKELRSLEGHEGRVNSVAFSPDGSRIASGGADKTVRIWEVATGEQATTMAEHDEGVACVAFGPEGRRIVSASGNVARMFDVNTNQELLSLSVPYVTYYVTSGRSRVTRPPFDSLAFSPNGRHVAIGTRDGENILVWDTAWERSEFILRGHSGQVRSVAFRCKSPQIAAACDDGTVEVRNAATGLVHLALRAHSGHVSGVAYSPDGEQLASAGADGTVRIWDATTGQELHTLRGHTGDIRTLQFAHNGKKLVSAGEDRTARVWDSSAGKELLVLAGHEGPIHDAALSPDGKYVVSAGDDGSLKVWDAVTGEEKHSCQGHTGAVLAVAVSPNGTQLASGGADRTARLWELSTGKEMFTLKRHETAVRSVAFSPDGKRLLAGTDGQDVKIWDPLTGQEALTLRGLEAQILSVAFAPDGRRIAAGCSDETIRIWDAAEYRDSPNAEATKTTDATDTP